VVYGAQIIEKHFTLNNEMDGPDHKASLNPVNFKLMVNSIRNIEKAMGNYDKVISPSEIDNREIVRKSIVASRDIIKGEFFSTDNLTTKRPGYGVSPMNWYDIIGKKSNKDYKKDEMIEQ
jgi:sialic acid synthase SpsE